MALLRAVSVGELSMVRRLESCGKRAIITAVVPFGVSHMLLSRHATQCLQLTTMNCCRHNLATSVTLIFRQHFSDSPSSGSEVAGTGHWSSRVCRQSRIAAKRRTRARLQSCCRIMAGGQTGVERSLELLHSELERTMALAGCNAVRKLGRSYVQPRR